MNVFNVAVSGLFASSTRLSNSANNIANMQSTSSLTNGQQAGVPYRPTDVTQQAIEPTGGVQTKLTLRDPATVPVYAPDHPDADAQGIVEFPNVSLETEVVEQQFATYNFKANLKSIEAADDMLQKTLDIFA